MGTPSFAEVKAPGASSDAAALPDGGGDATPASALRGMDYEAGQAALKPAEVDEALAYDRANFQKPETIAAIQAGLGLSGAEFDVATVHAVAAFQSQRGLAGDGKIGPRTWRALKPSLNLPVTDPVAKAQAAIEAPPPKPVDSVPKETANDKGPKSAPPVQAEVLTKEPPVARTILAATSGAAAGPLSKDDMVKAMADFRKHPIDPDWVAAFQAAIGVPVSGIVDEATMQGYAQKQKDAGVAKPDPKFWTATGRKVALQFAPGLAEVGQKRAAEPGKAASGQSVGVNAAEDAAVQKHGFKDLADYVSQFKKIQFLGHSVVGHTEFIARLRLAQAALAGIFPNLSDKEIGDKLGVTEVSHYRPSTEAFSQLYHGLGFAIDLNPRNNPWILGDTGKSKENKTETAEVIARACAFMGFGAAVTASTMKAMANATTEEAWESLNASSSALRDYRAMNGNRAAVEAHLARPDVPADIKAKGVDYWVEKIAADHLAFAKRNWKKGNTDDGFMDMPKILVQAMRDAAGLNWGAIEQGDQSGDTMHFDGRHISTAKNIRDAKPAAEPKKK